MKPQQWYGKRNAEKNDKGRWKPELGGMYFTICIDLTAPYILDCVWENDARDKELWRAHLVFRSKKEAQAALKRVKKALRG